MTTQIDLTPATPPGLHVHVPQGESASVAGDNPSDTPSPANVGTTNKAVILKISGTPGSVVRFANPS